MPSTNFLQNKEPFLYFLRLLCFSIVVAVAVPHAKAEVQAEVVTDWSGTEVFFVIVSGEILQNDADMLLSKKEEASAVAARLVLLDSVGGNLNAAMSMGKFFREMSFDVIIPPESVCYSACVFLLASGIDKTVEGNVGIHRPYFLTSGSVSIADAIKKIKLLSEEYLDEMNIPVRLVEDMFSVEPSSMRVLTSVELRSYRLNTKDYVAQEADTVRMMERYGKTRAEYDAFAKDMNYSCQVFMGNQAGFDDCASKVAKRHGIK